MNSGNLTDNQISGLERYSKSQQRTQSDGGIKIARELMCEFIFRIIKLLGEQKII